MRFDDYEIPLALDYKPMYAKPYAIPRSQETKAKEVIQRLINAVVLEQIYDSEMASPAFDYRLLNKFLRRRPYYVPRIREILMRLTKAKCISTFDANLGYYARRLANQSRPITAFCLPFGKFQYKRLPMGISTAPDECQIHPQKQHDEEHLEHLEHLCIVFERLERFNVILNGKKCHILREEVDYLGYTLSPEGIKPHAKKIQAIQQIVVPRNRKELRRFLGMISYYRDMVPNKSMLCKPLHRFTSSNVPFTWLLIDTEAFGAIQRAFAEAVLLSFPYLDKPFQLYADASGSQLGGPVMQDTKIIACYSRTLTKHQINYTTMELELLSIVELLREYRTILLGFPVVVNTDHKNLIYPIESSLRVKRWKLLLVEYRLSMRYIEGMNNVGADVFSRIRFTTDESKSLFDEMCAASDEVECIMHGPVLRDHQDADEMQLGKRVIVPDSLRDDIISWYHRNLGHPAIGVQPDKESLTKAESFDRDWHCRYPLPRKVVHDQRPEFTGEEFQELLRSYGINVQPIAAKNPQANAICERMHLEIGTVLRCHEGAGWRKVIYYPVFAVRASYHSILNASPGQLVFGQDMISSQLHDANWSYLSKRRFNAFLADNDRENDKRLEHFYKAGDQVLLRIPKHFRSKLKREADGPFPIKTVHDNDTVTLDKGTIQQQVSFRRIFPR
ncbi:Pol Polyprotein [Phytophthora megakarya]|uniref:Pol Polyprotein n=1 Tax=Phytophthora megakarya TaxID=4795 RepID=A0A225WIG1_9STRA|nr:Pol Polyprotein [Phytophthora megakarya]